MRTLNKKGVLDQLGGLVQTLGFLAILLAVVFLIVAEVSTQVDSIEGFNGSVETEGIAHNATNEVQSAMSDIPGWLPIIVVAVIGGILLGLIQFFRKR